MTAAIQWTDEMKRCAHCRHVKPRGCFGGDRSRPDGLTYWCRDCRNERGRRRHVSRSSGAAMGPPPLPERDGDARQARRTINHLVETGRIPPPNALPCMDCGHVWQAGERRHEYDHYHGYAAGHHRDVEPLCTLCHHARERTRTA